MKKSTVTINGENLVLKNSFRSLMEFEQMTGKNAYTIDASLSDSLKMFYCTLKAANPETFSMSFDTFLEALDDNPQAMQQYTDHMLSLVTPVEKAVADKKKAEKR